MKKYGKIVVLVTVIAILLLSGCRRPSAAGSASTSAEASDPRITLSYGGTAAADDWISKAMERVAERVSQRTGGSLTINVFPASQLGDHVAQMEAVFQGSQDMHLEGFSFVEQYGLPDVSAISFPFLFKTRDNLKKFSSSDLFKQWQQEFLDMHGARTLSTNWLRLPIVMTTVKPVRRLEDFRGLKLRIPPSTASIQTYGALGCNPTPVAYVETYLSLQQGVIEGTVASLDAQYTMGFYEVTKYLLMVNTTYSNMTTWIHEKKWQQLSKRQQDILVEELYEAGEWYMENVDKEVAGFIEKMIAHGTEIITYSDEEMDRFAAAVRPVAEEFEASGKWSKGLYDKVRELSQLN